VKFADSEDGIRSEFIKTPCGTKHTPLWDLIKTKEKSNYVAKSKDISFYLATLLMLCTKIKRERGTGNGEQGIPVSTSSTVTDARNRNREYQSNRKGDLDPT
jgi:hypothetical protein